MIDYHDDEFMQMQTEIFLHIPKTAGSTMNNILMRMYRPEQRHFFSLGDSMATAMGRFKNLPASQKAAIKLLYGHFEFGIHQYLPQPAHYFTLLRDPLERYISDYYFILKNPAHPLYTAATERNLNVVDLIESGLALDNVQTRTLAGRISHRQELCPPAALEQAKENLRNHFVVVGLTEEFDKTLLLLQYHLGWSAVHYKRENVNRQRPRRRPFSPAILKKLTRYTELDQEIYQYGKQLFHRQLEQMGPRFHLHARLFPLLNHSRTLYWQARKYSVRQWLRERFG